jgi:hypothetical protein
MNRDDKELDELDNLCMDDTHTELTPEAQKLYDEQQEFIAECEKTNRDCYPEE